MSDDYRDPKEIIDPWDRLRRLFWRLTRAFERPTPTSFDTVHYTLAQCLLDTDEKVRRATAIAEKALALAERDNPK